MNPFFSVSSRLLRRLFRRCGRVGGLWLAAGGMLAGLTSCVPREEGIEVLHYAIWGTARQALIDDKIARAFEAGHPGVRVDIMYFSAGYQEKMQAMIVGDAMPDVLMVDSMIYGDWASRGALRDLTGFVATLDRESAFMPVALDVFQLHDRIYVLPINAQSIVMYVNTTALAKAGLTLPDRGLSWDEIAALGPKLSRRAGNPAAPTDYLLSPPLPSELLLSFGVRLFDNAEQPTRVTVVGPQAVAAINFLRKLSALGWSVPLSAQRDEGPFQLFRDGRVALVFAGRYISTELHNQAGGFAWDIAPMPRANGGMAESLGTGLAIAKNTPHLALAESFLRFYGGKTAVDIAARGGRIVPVRREFAYGDDFLSLAPPPSIKLFSRSLEKGAGGPYLQTAGAREVYDVLFRRLEQAVVEPDLPSEEIVRLIQMDLERWLTRAREKGRL